ncbi:hypothetical protein N7532_005016 [Penicillium argentinense]|uniref:Uncharacterized protein n=1 Tax=Penicillium argentinense TaxID=1131581 RepID=A0A9W9FD40_9EURO|nr:uncharacterized protein N7532_005016 [Penicillium argentinense]KAJ5098015.1 hypothetical protein N7532_005016 [Penicillium argentinense]
MFRHWVLRASSVLTHRRMHSRFCDILENILDELHWRYQGIDQWITTPAQAARAKKSALRAAEEITNLILDESIREIRTDETRPPGDQWYFVTLNEIPEALWTKPR